MNWSIADFYIKAWKLTLENKKLWVLGLAVVLYGGSYNSGSSSQANDRDEDTEIQRSWMPVRSPFSLAKPTIPQTYAQETLEDVASPGIEIVSPGYTLLTNVYQSTPSYIYYIIFFEVIAFIVYAICFGLFASAWSKAALILGVSAADNHEKYTLGEISTKAFAKVRPMIWLLIIPALTYILGLILSFIVTLMFFAINRPIGVIVFLVWLVMVVYYTIKLAATYTWAIRHCVLGKEESGSGAFKKGWETSKGTLRKSIRLGLANVLVKILITIAFLLVIVAIALTMIPIAEQQNNYYPLGALVGIGLLTLWPLYSLVSGMIAVFDYATWHYAFKVVTYNEENT